MATHNELGTLGEALAAGFLIKQGYTILERNWTFQKAEIDIIAQKDQGIIVFVEVKTRNSAFFGDPQSFVTPAKVKLIVKAANEYLISNTLDAEARFDIIAVLKNSKEEHIQHFKTAFYHF